MQLEAVEAATTLVAIGDKCRKRLERFLMTGTDARKPANILAMFEAIKGRPATPGEIVQLHRKIPVARNTKP
jgi:hypothetical protein